MTNIKSVIIYYGTPIEVFVDLKRFCEVKKLSYNTWKQKKLPENYNDFSVEREAVGNKIIEEYIERMGEKIRIQ